MNPTVTITGDAVLVTELELVDHDLACYLKEQEAGGRPDTVRRALKIGLLSLCNSGTIVNVDFIQKEFNRLVEQMDQRNDTASEALDLALRENFGDEEGRLPRTLEEFLGDKGSLRRFVDDLFDENRRDSAIGRINASLGRYFDGDGALLANLLNPAREGSPLHQFRAELRDSLKDLNERLLGLEAAKSATQKERARGTAKGIEFEDAVEGYLAEIVQSTGDMVERTGGARGNSVRDKVGDFVVTLNPSWTRGLDIRVVLEAKDSAVTVSKMAQQLREARANRDALVAVAVYAPQSAPTGVAPLTLHGDDVFCVFDPETGDCTGLEAALRLARAMALVAARNETAEIDTGVVQTALAEIRTQVNAVQGMKGKLTSISNVADEVADGLSSLKSGVIAAIGRIEVEVASAAPQPGALSA